MARSKNHIPQGGAYQRSASGYQALLSRLRARVWLRHPRSVDLFLAASGVGVVFGWSGVLLDFWMLPCMVVVAAVANECVAREKQPSAAHVARGKYNQVSCQSHRSVQSAPTALGTYRVSSFITPVHANSDGYALKQREAAYGLRVQPLAWGQSRSPTSSGDSDLIEALTPTSQPSDDSRGTRALTPIAMGFTSSS